MFTPFGINNKNKIVDILFQYTLFLNNLQEIKEDILGAGREERKKRTAAFTLREGCCMMKRKRYMKWSEKMDFIKNYAI